MHHADTARNRIVGIGLISLTYVFFTLLDGSAKWLVQSVPVIVVVWLRFLTHTLIASALLFPLRGRALVRTGHLRWHLVRGLMFCAMTGINFWALQYLQLTVTASIFFTVPILIALVSAPLLGEKLDARRWAAILIGFAGVLVIVRPGSESFHPAMLLSLANAVLYAAFNLMTRKLAAYDSPETIQFLPAVVASVVLAPFALAAWESPQGWREWTLLCLMGVFGGTGHYLLAMAHRYAPASTLAPFLYQQILYMALFGYLVFGSVPDKAVWIGAAIVIASGLYLFARERRGR
ncbi:MAG: DMT family transporter [Betaproteobacteria bacterium]|nr:DMT family transporter [Betaproteobacteria bacterium]MDH5350366.1 DMT family transporter [Betaproteobacteria bacterium]